MAEPGQKPTNEGIDLETIADGQRPVNDEAGALVPGGVLPADVVSAPMPPRDSHGKFTAGGTGKGS